MQLKILVKLISFSGPIKANGYQMVRQKYLSTGCSRKKKKKKMQEEIRSSTEQVSRKLKYLYTDHNARPHTFTKRLSGRRCGVSMS